MAAAKAGLGDLLDDGSVVGGPLGEQGRDATGGGVVVGAQVLARQGGVRRVGVGVGALPAVVRAAAGARGRSGGARGPARGTVGRAVGGADPGQDLSLEVVMIAGLWSWPTRRGTTPVAGRGRRGFRSSRSAAAAAA